MSDTGLGETTAPAEVVPSSEPAEPAERSILDSEPPENMRSFTREQMSEVRDEAAKHRIAAREARERIAELEADPIYQVANKYTPEDKATWVQFMDGWLENPQQTANDFRMIANNVLGDPTSTAEEKAEAIEVLEQTENMEALTPEAVQALVDEKLSARDQQAQTERAIDAVHTQIAEAGFPKGTADNFKVLWIANNDPAADGDVSKAIDIMKQERQAIIDEYNTNLRNGVTPKIAPDGGFAGQTETPITSMEDAANAAKAFLAGRQRS